jgi:hypothetical protein
MATPDININQILNDANAPAWATESTLEMILSAKRVENEQMKKAFKSLTGKDFEYNGVKQGLADVDKAFTKANKLAVKLEKNTKDLVGSLSSGRDTNPIEATAELMSLAANALDGVVGSVTKYTQLIPGAGRAVSWGLDAVTGLGVAAAGVSIIFAKIISEQEKALRTIINYGAVVGDVSQYTKMRHAVANVGMSMQEMSKLMDGNKAMLANLPGDLVSATTEFAKFAGTVEESKELGSFGYNVEQQTSRLLEEAKLMYMSGQLEQFGQLQKDKIRKNFESSSTMTTFLANKFGDQRSSLLALRSEALTNVDFMSALARNGEYLGEKYGENAKENVKASAASMKMLFTKVLGPTFGEQSEQVFNRFIKDIHIDASVLNDMPAEMIDTLNALGPDVMSNFKNIMEKAGTGQLTENQTVMAVQKLAKSISKAKPRFGDDPIVLAQNELIANARVAPEAFLDMTTDTLTAGLNSVRALTAQASGSIEAVDDARIAFRKIVTSLEPSYSASTTALDLFSGSLGLVEGALRLVGMIPKERKEPNLEPYVNDEGFTSRIGKGHPGALATEEGGKYSDVADIGNYDYEDTSSVVTNLVNTALSSRPSDEPETEERISKGQQRSANIETDKTHLSVVAKRGPSAKKEVPVINTTSYETPVDANSTIADNISGTTTDQSQTDTLLSNKMIPLTASIDREPIAASIDKQPVANPIDASIVASIAASIDKPIDTPIDKPIDKPIDTPIDKPIAGITKKNDRQIDKPPVQKEGSSKTSGIIRPPIDKTPVQNQLSSKTSGIIRPPIDKAPVQNQLSNILADVTLTNKKSDVNHSRTRDTSVADKRTSNPIATTNNRTQVTTSSNDKNSKPKMSIHLEIMSLLDNKIMNYIKDITEETEKAALKENVYGE